MIDTTSIKISSKNLFNSEGSSPDYLQTTSNGVNGVNDLYEKFLDWQEEKNNNLYEEFLDWQKEKKENKENKGDKNMDDLEVILQKYKKYQIDFIDAETETNLANLREKSKIGKLVKKIKEQFIKEIEKIYPEEKNIEDFISISYVDTKDLREKIDEEIELHDIQIESLNSDIDDARALLAIAETYEQKMQILKNYNIIDEEGRINIYE